MRVLAIDPGNELSAYALIDVDTRRPLQVGKVPNIEALEVVSCAEYDHLAVEMIASYGMAVGRTVFETCVWVGRFIERYEWLHVPALHGSRAAELVYRKDVKLHHCMSAKAKDGNVRQALVDRFAHGEPNGGKGTKAAPGWFYGFAADIWQAYAVGVLVADRIAAEVLA